MANGYDQGGAIPDDVSPPISTDNTNDQPSAVAQPQPAGLPDVGEPESSKLIPTIKRDWNQGVENLKQSAPVQFIKHAYETPSDPHAEQGKGPDPHAAAQAATDASKHMLDGSTTKFVANADGGGFTATVKDANNVHQSFDLTPEQFAQWTRPGGAGQWDKVLAGGGTVAALAQLTSGGTRKPVPGKNDEGETEDVTPGEEGTGIAGTGFTKDQVNKVAPPEEGGWASYNKAIRGDEEQNAAALRRFPWASQGAQRRAFTSQEQQREEELKNKKDIAEGQERARLGAARERAGGQVGAATARASGTVEAAKVRAEGSAKAQQQKAQLALQKMAQQHLDADARNRINVATRLINNPNWATQSADERNAILKKYGLDQLVEPATTPPAAAPGVGPLPGQDTQGRPQTQVQSPQDQQAIAWANAHPNDPRAAKIKQLHGIQ
jgi:hypothetical protein